MRIALFQSLFWILIGPVCVAAGDYSGEQHSRIKALSADEVSGYLSGQGMGMAKAAELNGYPGPKHVLELSKDLKLTEEQRRASAVLFKKMKRVTSELGQQLIQQEEMLEIAFSEGSITEAKLQQSLREIARLQAEIRREHLVAHIEQRVILTDRQTQHYGQLRGYDQAGRDLHRHHSQDHAP